MAAKKEPVHKYKPPLDCEVDHDEQGLQIILCGNLDMNGRPARAKATYADDTAMRSYCPQCGYGFVYYNLESHCWTCEMCGRLLQYPNPRQVLARFVYDATIPEVKAVAGAAPAPRPAGRMAQWRIEDRVLPDRVEPDRIQEMPVDNPFGLQQLIQNNIDRGPMERVVDVFAIFDDEGPAPRQRDI